MCLVSIFVYKNECLLCRGKGQGTVYIGETARTIWERNGNHQSDALSSQSQSTSHMKCHMLSAHPDKLQEVIESFQVSRVKSCPTALGRQVREAIEIGSSQQTLLNCKEEYNRCLLPAIHVTGPPPIRIQEEEDEPIQELSESQVIQALDKARIAHKKRRKEVKDELESKAKKIKISWLYQRDQERAQSEEERSPINHLLMRSLKATKMTDYITATSITRRPVRLRLSTSKTQKKK